MLFWPGLRQELESDHGPRGRQLGRRAALSVAIALIALPYVLIGGAVAAVLGSLAFFIRAVKDAVTPSTFSLLVDVALSMAIVLPVAALGLYVIARVLDARMFKRSQEARRQVEAERHRLAAHWRQHDESPSWHLAIVTPQDARENYAEIRRIILSYHYEIEDAVQKAILEDLERQDRERERYG